MLQCCASDFYRWLSGGALRNVLVPHRNDSERALVARFSCGSFLAEVYPHGTVINCSAGSGRSGASVCPDVSESLME